MSRVYPNSEFEKLYKENSSQYIHPLVVGSLLSHSVIPEVGILNYLSLGNKFLLHLGDPICDPSQYETVFDTFILEAKKRKLHPVFFLISENFARFCSQKEYLCNSLGPTAFFDLTSYEWKGKLNRNANHVQKMGVTVRHVQIDSPSHPDYIRLCEFNKKWLSMQKQKRELQLAVGRLDEIFLKENHIFIAEKDHQIQGFISAYPYYDHSKVSGYFLDILRRDQKTYKRGVIELLVRTSFQFFKATGATEYSMGWMPLSLDTEIFPHSKAARIIFKEVFHHGNFLYSFKNVAFFKKRYHPFFRKNYFACPQKASPAFLTYFAYVLFKKIGFAFYPLHWVKRWLKRSSTKSP